MFPRLSRRSFLLSSAAIAVAPAIARAATSAPAFVDASAPTPTPQTGVLQLGSAASTTARSGQTLTVDSQSLILNGQRWLPVAGEFHYTRYPADQWLPELLKMKAAGVDTVSTYIIWIHHEEVQNQFVFSGDHDLARFIDTCAQAGLKVIARLGPYVHAEVRNGGIPDWVIAQSTKIRSNDPVYLSFVTSFWTQVADRIASRIWKSGGPIIAVQLENEYNLYGTGADAVAHITTLKQLAISLGFDMPLYTVTGWQDTAYPADQVVPVFAGYQDMPWGTALTDMPPSETYSFRFFSREEGDYGYPDKYEGGYDPNSQASLAQYPFFSVEYGGGAASMYRRRVVLNLPDDVAAILPAQLGSGVNLVGYYMFHGGRNPRGKTETLQESTASGSYNDLPIINYDYQSPLGQYGEERASLARLKLYHYFLNQFGAGLAAMSLRQPATIPNGAADLSSLRWSVRSNGNSGYLFVNNYVRQYAMAAHPDTQFSVKFADQTVTLPNQPITIPTGAYFIWPLNLALADATLAYATAQLVTAIEAFGQTVYVFAATDGISVEFAFDPATVSNVQPLAATIGTDTAGRTLVSNIAPGVDLAIRVTSKSGAVSDILVLSEAQADDLWRVSLGNTDILLLTSQQFDVTPTGFAFTNAGSPNFSFATFPAIKASSAAGQVQQLDIAGLFTLFAAEKRSKSVPVSVTQASPPGLAPPIVVGGQAKGALQPTQAAITAAQGLWTVSVPWSQLADIHDVQLTIAYAGDFARLYAGTTLIDDHFYDGQPWTVGVKRLSATNPTGAPLTLAIMPLRSDAPIYLQAGAAPAYGSNGQACAVISTTVTPVYRLQVTASV